MQTDTHRGKAGGEGEAHVGVAQDVLGLDPVINHPACAAHTGAHHARNAQPSHLPTSSVQPPITFHSTLHASIPFYPFPHLPLLKPRAPRQSSHSSSHHLPGATRRHPPPHTLAKHIEVRTHAPSLLLACGRAAAGGTLVGGRVYRAPGSSERSCCMSARTRSLARVRSGKSLTHA